MIKGGPKIIDDSLVLCLDAHDADSYAGEPTTNLISNGGFENNTTSGWSFDPKITGSFSVTSEDKKSGLYSAKLTNSTSNAIALWKSISITSGQQYTISAWIKNVSCPTTPYFSVSSGGTFNGTSSGTSTTGVTAGSDWVYISKTFTATNTQTTNPYIRTSYTSTQGYFLVDDFQIENKTYSTPFANTTRSATDGWKDLTTNDHDGSLLNGTVTGATHYRDGQVIMPVANSYLDFDGSDDYVMIDHSTQLNNAKTWEIWINIDSFPASNTLDSVFQKSANWNNDGGILLSMIYGSLRFSYGGYWGGVTIEQLSNMSTGTWYQVVGTGQFLGAGAGVLMKGYLNGAYKAALTDTSAFVPTNSNTLYLGYGNGGTMNGKIGLVRVYEDTLTAAEILSNYNATKNRFT